MAEVLLKELSNADIDWLIAVGRQQQISIGTVLLQPKSPPDAVYLLLDGVLTMRIPQSSEDCTASLSIPQPVIEPEITRLSRGEIIGEELLLNVPTAAVVQAAEDSIVLSISQQQFLTKLQQDSDFSARLYRAIALILSQRLQQMLSLPKQFRTASDHPVKEALFLFGELRDSDIDWLVAAGHLEKLPANKILVPAGRPLDALYIILDGLFSVAVHEEDMNLLALCFECAEKNAATQKVIEQLSRGEMSGTVSFLNSSPSPITIRAVEESLVLAVLRSRLTLRLQQDAGFAARFHRVLSIQLSETLQTAVGLLGCPQQMHQAQDGMDQEMEYDDELNADSLHKVAQGAARFNWMLKRLGVM